MYGGLGVSAPSLHRESTDSLIQKNVVGCRDDTVSSVYKCKSCRDDTMSKTIDTRRQFESMQQSSTTPKNREGVAEDCCMLPCSAFLYL